MSDFYNRLNADPTNKPLLRDLAVGLEAAYSKDKDTVAEATRFWRTGPVTKIRWGPGVEDYYFLVESAPEIVGLDPGTETTGTLVNQITGYDQFPWRDVGVNFPGQAGAYWQGRAVAMKSSLITAINTIRNAQPGVFDTVIFAGHSLGAAEAVCLGCVFADLPVNDPKRMIVTFACPRVLDPAAAEALTTPHIRVHNLGDPIVQLPPPTPPRRMNFFFWAGLPGFAGSIAGWINYNFYVHHGRGVLLYPDDRIEENNLDPYYGQNDNTAFFTYVAVSQVYDISFANYHYIRTGYIDNLGDPGVDPSWPRGVLFGDFSMPIDAQCLMAIEGTGSGLGWTDTVYMSGAPNIENALANFAVLANKRAACLSGGAGFARLNEIRVSDLSVLGDSLIKTRNSVGPIWDGSKGTSGYPTTCLLLRVIAGSLYRRAYMLAGIPDEVEADGGLYVPGALPGFSGALTNFTNYLKNIPAGPPFFCIRAFKKPPAAVSVAITSITLSIVPPLGVATVTTGIVPHGLVTGDMVKISGVSWAGAKKPKGTYFVKFISATSFEINYVNSSGVVIPFVGTYLGGGLATKKESILVPITDVQIEKIRERRRGQVFGQPRGRRRVRTRV